MITQNELKRRMKYDAKSGAFTWLLPPKNKAQLKGVRAGAQNSCGYRQIRINKKLYLEHRLAWLYVHGEMPNQIDHINGDRADNRLENLRSVTTQENQRNMAMQTRNSSGCIGVYKSSKHRWSARVTVDGSLRYLGSFARKSDAIAARKAAEIEIGFHPNHGRRQ